ncbi:MAG TPA: sialidase family protein [Candidatus Thermoplasmatota archaeon]|nr:sialidase family protein [Candidatus Thermoplasmatota archaeon]
MKTLLVSLLVATLAIAGCFSSTDSLAPAGAEQDAPALGNATHVLANAVEPAGLEALGFELLGAVSTGGPVYGLGEPSIWAHLDGTIYLAFPGCEGVGSFVVDVPGQPQCGHGQVYKSTDDGKTWELLNRADRGRLTEDGPDANGDADVAVDSAGTVYVINLYSGITFHRSTDGGATWQYMANIVPEEHWADRQWIAASHPGHAIVTWMGGATGEDRQVAITTTWDGGENFTNVTYLGENIGWLGTVQFDTSGTRAFIPFTQAETSNEIMGLAPAGANTFRLYVARTLDGGLTWDVVDTKATVAATSGITGQWSGVLMAPALDVTGDGHVLYVYSEEVPAPTGVVGTYAAVKVVASPDWGGNWTEPQVLSTAPVAIMPWVTGGAGDRFAVTWFQSPVPLAHDYAGKWDVAAAIVDGLADGKLHVKESIVDTNIHLGGLCTRGGACLITGADRALLDFFESDLMPDGRLVLTYPADPPQGGKRIEIRTAIQNAGSLLLEPPATTTG